MVVLNAFQASPITIGDRQAAVEEKRTNTRGNSKFIWEKCFLDAEILSKIAFFS